MMAGLWELSDEQEHALDVVSHREHPAEVVDRASSHLRRWGRACGFLEQSTDQVTINFHPDRPTSAGILVLESVLASGRWQNQFESGTSNGFALGDKDGIRTRCESMHFGGAYDRSTPEVRPKYAGLNVYAHPRGAWPRFGSCHWRLAPVVLERCTVTVGGSHASRAWSSRPQGLLNLLLGSGQGEPRVARTRFHLIDGVVEVQVHGEVLLDRDIDALVLDPSFHGTRVEQVAAAISDRYGVRVEWGPQLVTDPRLLKATSARAHASRRLADAVRDSQAITAHWIGIDLCPYGSPVPLEVRERAARYLWNRLLLNQPPVGPDL